MVPCRPAHLQCGILAEHFSQAGTNGRNWKAFYGGHPLWHCFPLLSENASDTTDVQFCIQKLREKLFSAVRIHSFLELVRVFVSLNHIFSKQLLKADTSDILWPSLNLCLKMVVNNFIPPPTSLAHAARNSQLHKDSYNISTPWRSFPLHGAKYCHHTHRTWDGEGMDVPWHSILHSAKQSMAIQRGTVQGSEFMWSLGLFSLEKRRDLTAFTTSSQMEAEGQAVISSLWWSVTGPEEMARSCVRGVWIEY